SFAEPFALRGVAVDIEEGLTGETLRVSDGETEPAMTASEVSCGPVFCEISREGNLAGSTVVQKIRLYGALPLVEVVTELDWKGERQLQVRLAFEFDIPEGVATYESPFYAVTMPDGEMEGTYRGTGGRMIGKWVSISAPDGSFGATIATSLGCASINGPKLHMLLLRTTFSCGTPFLWYELRGRHSFRHAVLAHEGDWRRARAFRLGWEFTTPLFVVRMATARPIKPWPDAHLPPEGSLLSVSAENAVVTTILPSATREEAYIVRLFDATGEGGEAELEFCFPLSEAVEVDLLERPLCPLTFSGRRVRIKLRPFGIHNILLVPAEP
ncbi:MAG TPA: hypothetical protein EYP65_03710, partial [Armatimonadetes bacterium]|nr:hypothetical protein [Armatimonadota bacterium]